jgi:preprotein translocase subunit SecY
MNVLGKVGLALFLLGWVCFFGMFVAAFIVGSEYVFQVLLAAFFLGALSGFILMLISVLYDRYKQLRTEEIRPKV